MLYFDNAATTKADPEILEKFIEYQTEKYFNPSSLNRFSAEVAKDIASARKRIGDALGLDSNGLIFTSGGTESANMAIFGVSFHNGCNIVTTETEHSAVYNSAVSMKNKGCEVRFAAAKSDGSVDEKDLSEKVDGKTVLVAVMHVNNETGAVNDIKSLVKTVKAKNPCVLFFSDGTQAAGKIPLNVNELGVDMYALSGHKFHAPKGIGALYVKKGVTLKPFHIGGGQENGLRSGTENVGGIVAMSYALEKAVFSVTQNNQNFARYRQILKNAFDVIGDCKILAEGSSAILCAAFGGIKSQVLSNILEQDGIVVGLGSACSSKNKRNRVMLAAGLGKHYIEGVVRLSFSRYNTVPEIEALALNLIRSVEYLRKLN